MSRILMRLHFDATHTAAISIPGTIKKFLEDNYGIGNVVMQTQIVDIIEDVGFSKEETE